MDDITRISRTSDYGTRPKKLLHCRGERWSWTRRLDEERKRAYLEVSP
jgi:hypothetical protein